jgi:predicted TIM-barrel fold metal-dependent hydrolase
VKKALANVYYDTAASPFVYSKRIYPIGCEIAGSEKILFGSDFPLISPRRYFREMEESGMKREDQRRILGLNLARLLRLDLP